MLYILTNMQCIIAIIAIIQCTQLVEFARDAYADNGSSLLDSIAVVHPFTISALIHKTRDNIGVAGEVCVCVCVCVCACVCACVRACVCGVHVYMYMDSVVCLYNYVEVIICVCVVSKELLAGIQEFTSSFMDTNDGRHGDNKRMVNKFSIEITRECISHANIGAHELGDKE